MSVSVFTTTSAYQHFDIISPIKRATCIIFDESEAAKDRYNFIELYISPRYVLSRRKKSNHNSMNCGVDCV